MDDTPIPGATCPGRGRCRFVVWAPDSPTVEVRLCSPAERRPPLQPLGRGYPAATVDGVPPGGR